LTIKFLFYRIQEEIDDYIPSLDQGLAILTNSTLPLRNASHSLVLAFWQQTYTYKIDGSNMPKTLYVSGKITPYRRLENINQLTSRHLWAIKTPLF